MSRVRMGARDRAGPRVAVFGLVRAHPSLDGYRLLRQRNRLLAQHVLAHHRSYEALIFHEGDVKTEHQSQLALEMASLPPRLSGEPPLRFVNASALWRRGLRARSAHCASAGSACQSTEHHAAGYQQMCRFVAVEAAPLLRSMGYAYGMRVDDDGLITSHVRANIAAAMRSHRWVYAARHVHSGKHGEMQRTLVPWVERNLASRALAAHAPALGTVHFYNNFLLMDLAWWCSAGVRSMLGSKGLSAGIWEHGWGDSVIMSLALQAFASPSLVVQLTGLGYEHAKPGSVKRFPPGESRWTYRTRPTREVLRYFCSIVVFDQDLSSARPSCAGACKRDRLPANPPRDQMCNGVQPLELRSANTSATAVHVQSTRHFGGRRT